MEQSFNTGESFEQSAKSDRKKKLETQRRIRELKEQHQLEKELDYFGYEVDWDTDD